MMSQVDPFEHEKTNRLRGDAALREASRFFMNEGKVYETLRAIARKLDELQIPYAIAGGMALTAHGYRRTTEDVDLIVTEADLEKIHQELEGRGYVRPFAGSKNLTDTQRNIRIEFLISGQFPGDGKPKPVAFPDPSQVSVDIDGIRYVGLPTLIELKLASGMTGRGRLRDLGDVQELIRALSLPREFLRKLDPFVRDKFLEVWDDLPPDQQRS